MSAQTGLHRLVVSPRTLAASINRHRFIDTTWFMPNTPRDPYAEFLKKRIPKAKYLDLDAVASSHPLGLKHMMPSPELFASTCSRLGIHRDDSVVLYDTQGVFTSPRALFMFRAFGHQKSSILDGGLPAWEAEGLPIELEATAVASQPDETAYGPEYPVPEHFAASGPSSVIADYHDIRTHASKPLRDIDEIVLDARSSGRFAGQDPEPRPGLKSGHMPNSLSLPFTVFLQKHPDLGYTTLLPEDKLKQALVDTIGQDATNKILDGKLGVITSCGSGMTAAVLWLGLKLLGAERIKLYDESWTGYAMRYPETTILP